MRTPLPRTAPLLFLPVTLATLLACGDDVSLGHAGNGSGGGSYGSADSSVAVPPMPPPIAAPEFAASAAISEAPQHKLLRDAEPRGAVAGGVAMSVANAATPAPSAPSMPAPAASAATSAAATGTRVPAMLIRTAMATIAVDSLDLAIARIEALARTVGGFVANSAQSNADRGPRSGTFVLKVPVYRFDDALHGLAPLGKVEHLSAGSEDVGEEFTDVGARMANARRLEARLVDLLATRTGRLSDVLTVERELARVREEIERYEGRLRFLGERVAFSTITITLHEPIPLTATETPNPLGDALRSAWQNAVALTVGLVSLLGFVIPLAALAAVPYLLLRAWRRRHPRAASVPVASVTGTQ